MWGHGSGEGGNCDIGGLMGTPSVLTRYLCYVGMLLDGLREEDVV